MSLIIPEDLPDCIDKPIEKALTPVSEGIGKTLGDLWFLAMGGISHLADKKKIKYAVALEELKKSLENKINDIPIEQRIEPNTQIVCQALEDAKYCAENKDIREMFANLIASTMNSQSSAYVHPSFSEILKQMTTNEARFLIKIRENGILPVCSIIANNNNTNRFDILFKDLYLETSAPFEKEVFDNAFILSALSRQGLIEVTYSRQLADDNAYKVFYKSLFFKSKAEWEEKKGNISVTLKKGAITLTYTGKTFLQVCCPAQKDLSADAISSAPTAAN